MGSQFPPAQDLWHAQYRNKHGGILPRKEDWARQIVRTLSHGVHEFVVAGAKPLYATGRAMAMETSTPPCAVKVLTQLGNFGSDGAKHTDTIGRDGNCLRTKAAAQHGTKYTERI